MNTKWFVGLSIYNLERIGPRSHHNKNHFSVISLPSFFFNAYAIYIFVPCHLIVWSVDCRRHGFSDVSLWYSLSQNPFTHFDMISLANVPTWYVPFLLLTIQNRLVQRNLSLLGIKPHDDYYENSPISDKYCLFLIHWVHPNLVIGTKSSRKL